MENVESVDEIEMTTINDDQEILTSPVKGKKKTVINIVVFIHTITLIVVVALIVVLFTTSTHYDYDDEEYIKPVKQDDNKMQDELKDMRTKIRSLQENLARMEKEERMFESGLRETYKYWKPPFADGADTEDAETVFQRNYDKMQRELEQTKRDIAWLEGQIADYPEFSERPIIPVSTSDHPLTSSDVTASRKITNKASPVSTIARLTSTETTGSPFASERIEISSTSVPFANTSIITAASAVRACSAEWTNASNGLCYRYFMSVKVNYITARSACKNFGARLAAIGLRNASMRSEIRGIFPSPIQSTWIGLDNLETQGTYMWSDGERSTEGNTDWGSIEPDNAAQRCAAMHTRYDGGVADLSCSEAHNYICETIP